MPRNRSWLNLTPDSTSIEWGRGAWVQRGQEREREGFVHQAY